jgi:hypothetical protein
MVLKKESVDGTATGKYAVGQQNASTVGIEKSQYCRE